VDLTGAATAKDYDSALTSALKSDHISSVICLGCETAMFDAEKFAGMVKKKYEAYKTRKPIVFSMFGGEVVENGIEKLRKEGVPIFTDVYDAVSCLGALNSYQRSRSSHAVQNDPVKIDVSQINTIIENAKSEGRHFLFSNEGQEVMKAVGVRMPKSFVAKDIKTAVKHAEKIGYPVVMKVVSRDILHKSDVGGVALDLENKREVVEAYESIINHCKAHVPHAYIEGVEVTEMVREGVETIVGARVDHSFGPIVMFGLGGVYVEVMKDVSFRAFPLSRAEAMSMVSEIKSYPLLLGVRGEERKDIDSVIEAILKVGTIIDKCPLISDIEINPLTVYDQGEGVRAVDVRIMLSQEG